jgi:putative hydrolase of the HAD superfamily
MRALVLDLDDTLVAAGRAIRRAERVLLELGVDRQEWRTVFERWWSRFERGEVSAAEMRFARWADLGLPGDAGVAADAAWRSVAFGATLRHGARAFLRDARVLGFRLVILTNGTVDPQRLTIERTGLVSLVDGVVITEEIGVHKPRAEPFQRAAALVNVDPAQATMVGDNLSLDIIGALGAGYARAVWITARRTLPELDPRVVVVRRLDQVLPALGERAALQPNALSRR